MIELIVLIIVAALALWAVEQFPLDATLVRVIRVIVIVVVCLYALAFLLSLFGFSSGLPVYHFSRSR